MPGERNHYDKQVAADAERPGQTNLAPTGLEADPGIGAGSSGLDKASKAFFSSEKEHFPLFSHRVSGTPLGSL